MRKSSIFIIFLILVGSLITNADENSEASIAVEYREEFDGYSAHDIPNWELIGAEKEVEIVEDNSNKLLKVKSIEKTVLQKQFKMLSAPFVVEFKINIPENGALNIGFVNEEFYIDNFIQLSANEGEILIKPNEMQKITFVISKGKFELRVNDKAVFENKCAVACIRGINFEFLGENEYLLDDIYAYAGKDVHTGYELLSFEEKFSQKLSNSVILFTGLSEALVNGEFKKIDENSPSIQPLIADGITYLPLRFIAEAFGMSVDWNENTKEIIMKGGNVNISIRVGEDEIVTNGIKKSIDAIPFISNGRTMIPLRAVALAMEKYVFWDDRGLILVSDEDKFFDTKNPIEVALIDKIDKKMHRNTLYTDEDGEYHLVTELVGDEINVQSVMDSANDGHIPENVIDKNLLTRWSAEFEQWILFDLGEEKYVDNIAIAWSNGSKRKAKYDIEISNDNVNWKRITDGSSSSGVTDNFEVSYLKQNFRYLRYMGHGNSSSGWNSITEFRFFSK